MILGGVLVVIGGLIVVLPKIGFPLGSFPGDISIRQGNLTCFVPIVTSIVLSIFLTIFLNIVIRLLNR